MVLAITGIVILTVLLMALVCLYVKWLCNTDLLGWLLFNGCWLKVIGAVLKGIAYCIVVVINVASGSGD